MNQSCSNRPRYSLVIAAYNEHDIFPHLVDRLVCLMDRLDGSAEVIFVDDGSVDDTCDLMVRLANQDDRFKMIQLSRNFGHQTAVTAGINYARGDAVVILDADLQDPPEVVLDMAAKWKEGYDVVYAVRKHREGETIFKKLSAFIFYRGLQRMTRLDIPPDVGDFRLIDRKVVEAFNRMPETSRFLRGMFTWAGFKQIGVPYHRSARVAGESKYPFRKMIRLAADAVLSFSNMPLRIVLYIGFLTAALAACLGVTTIGLKLTGVTLAPGWASLIVVIVFLGGVNLLVLGVVGEYLARIYEEVRQRPLYFVREARGFQPAAAKPEAPVDGDTSSLGQPVITIKKSNLPYDGRTIRSV